MLIGFGIGILLLVPIFALTPESGHPSDYIWLALTRFLVWTGMVWFLYERKAFFEGRFSLTRFVIVVIFVVLFSFAIDAAYSWVSGEFPGWLTIGMC